MPEIRPEPVSIVSYTGRMGRVLGFIERAGNRLPHPFYLFLGLAIIVALVSALCASLGAATVNPANGERIEVKSVLSGEGAVMILTDTIKNFVNFPPLGLIITVMLGIGLAERVGLMTTFMRSMVSSAPRWAVTVVVVLVSLMGNLASDASMIIIPPLAAAAFLAAGRHPLAGFITSYAATAAGFTANVIIAGTDVLMAGITTSAAHIVDPDTEVSPLANWFFMSASMLVLAAVLVLLCHKVVEPKLGNYDSTKLDPALREEDTSISPEQRRGLRWAGVSVLIYLALVVASVAIPTSPLRGEGGQILRSPFMTGLPVFILLFFVVAGVAYGRASGSLRAWSEIPDHMVGAVKDLVPFIVVIFTAAQAIAWFNWSNVGMLVATSGSSLMESAGLNGIWGLVLFSLICTLPVLMLTSGSAVWTMLAPIFVPMFMLSGVDPAYVQAAFRITDSVTNPLVPMNPMLPVVLGLMQRYEPKAGLGTLFSLVIPFTLTLWVVWIALFVVWGLLGLPIGPGHELMLPTP